MAGLIDGQRRDGRGIDELRKVQFIPDVNPYAEGSVEVCFGQTKLLCTASIEEEIPRWMEPDSGGWITAEYGMLPRSTHTRMKREAAAGKQGGRTLEIQRLIGRALRRAIDLKALGGITIRLDCDVVVADGGTRTAAISGGWVALNLALNKAKAKGVVPAELALTHIAAVSVGKVSGELCLDLCYDEDANAQFDLNLVFDERNDIIEVQGTAEQGVINVGELNELITLGQLGARQIIEAQKQALRG